MCGNELQRLISYINFANISFTLHFECSRRNCQLAILKKLYEKFVNIFESIEYSEKL